MSVFTKLIGSGESKTIEWKRSLSEIKGIIQTVCAFANSSGGKIFVGVNDDGTVCGIEAGKRTIEQLVNQITQSTDPSIVPEVSVCARVEKTVIVIEVKESIEHLTLASGRPYKRAGKSTVKISRAEYERMVLEKHKEALRFDSAVCPGAKPADIDRTAVREFLNKAKRERSLDIDENAPAIEALERMKLAKANRLTNAGVLLFAKDPQKYFLQAVVKVIRFKGITVTGEMLDFKMYEGDIISQLKRAEDFIFEHIPIRAWIENGKLERQEKWLYPPKAIREALANAFAHRDYRMTSHVQVRIFDDRMEIWSPGGLPKGITVRQLKKRHDSVPRNPLIARAFFWIKYAEEVGTGTNKLMDWCKEWGLPDPDFEDTGTSLVTTFRHPFVTEAKISESQLNERQRKAMDFLKINPVISRKQYVDLTGVSLRQANKDLSVLLKKNILVRTGRGRSIGYKVHD